MSQWPNLARNSILLSRRSKCSPPVAELNISSHFVVVECRVRLRGVSSNRDIFYLPLLGFFAVGLDRRRRL